MSFLNCTPTLCFQNRLDLLVSPVTKLSSFDDGGDPILSGSLVHPQVLDPGGRFRSWCLISDGDGEHGLLHPSLFWTEETGEEWRSEGGLGG